MTTTSTHREFIRCSGKQLGGLALDACDRCVWLRLKMPRGLPYQIFPGIFSSIDAFSKNVVHGHFDSHGRPPAWLAELGDLVAYIEPPHWSRFQMLDEVHGVLLTGAADGIYVRRDGTLVVVDFKTARYSKGQDALLLTYIVQLNVYRQIAEYIGLGRVSSLALVYTEPVTEVASYKESNTSWEELSLRFQARVVPVETRPDILPPLLQKLRQLRDMPAPPAARAGCRDCVLADEMLRCLRCRQRRPV